MVAAQVIGNQQAVTIGGMQGQFELNVFMPLIGSNVLRSIDLLSVGMDSFATRMVDGIEANEDRIKELVDRSLMLVTALAPVIGYDNAAKIAKHAHQNGQTLKEAGLELGLVDEDTFDEHVKPENMVGRVGGRVLRSIFRHCEEPIGEGGDQNIRPCGPPEPRRSDVVHKPTETSHGEMTAG